MTKSIGRAYVVDSVGVFSPKLTNLEELKAGEVGFVIAGIKDIQGAPVGDTITHVSTPDVPAVPGFQKVKPQVYAGMFPVEDRKSTRLNSSHVAISYAVFCL